MLDKPGSGILGYLKSQQRNPSELPFNVLREFQEFKKMLLETNQNNMKNGIYGAVMNDFIKV